MCDMFIKLFMKIEDLSKPKPDWVNWKIIFWKWGNIIIILEKKK